MVKNVSLKQDTPYIQTSSTRRPQLQGRGGGGGDHKNSLKPSHNIYQASLKSVTNSDQNFSRNNDENIYQ